MRKDSVRGFASRQLTRLSLSLLTALSLTHPATAQTFAPVTNQPPPGLTRDLAIHYALQNNPALMTTRQQYGYAQAAIVLAKTYPFNPIYTGYVAGMSGAAESDFRNRVFTEDYVTLELELRGQGGHRRAAASAGASRIEWEIAQQEMALSIAVVRAFNTVLYRQKKLEVLEESLKLTEQSFEQLKRQVDSGKIKPLDIAVVRADLESARAQGSQLRTTLAGARSDLRKLLGTLDDSFAVLGKLDVPLPGGDQASFTQLALEQRPDLHARRAAICEVEANLRLVESNRYGNPQVGPFYSLDDSRISTIGARIVLPLPVLNTKRAEIMKAQTDVSKVRFEVQQLETQASQDVMAALTRYTNATKWAAAYETDVVPGLLSAKQEMERLLAQSDPSVDAARFLVVQRAYLKAIETLLDARFEVSQAQADLALAVAEPMLAVGPGTRALPARLGNPH
jgi:cobalt-zinc-cadmium efflux system outer membrane protein